MRLLLVLPVLLACRTDAVTTDADGDVQTVAAQDLNTLAATVAALQEELDETQAELAATQGSLGAAEARIAALEQQVAALEAGGTGGGGGGVTQEDLDALEYAVVVSLDALDARVAGVEGELGELSEGFDLLAVDVDALLAGSGTPAWSATTTSPSISLTHGSTWGAVTSTTLSLTRTDPVVAWCLLQEADISSSTEPSYYKARLTLESPTGTIQESEEITVDAFADVVIASFTPEEAGDHTLTCEVKDMRTLGMEYVQVIAMQAAAVVDGGGI